MDVNILKMDIHAYLSHESSNFDEMVHKLNSDTAEETWQIWNQYKKEQI